MIGISSARSTQAGMTLVEVMVGMVLTSILVLGLAGLWNVVNDHFLRLTLKQKAVFVLNNEVARLTAIYRRAGSIQYVDETDHYPAEHPAAPSYRVMTGVGGVALPLTSAGRWGANELAYWDRGVAGDSADDRDVVWLDYERGVVAVVSWVVDSTALDFCTTKCPLITVYLDYPYRYVDATSPAASMPWEDTLSVRTIVRSPNGI